MHKFINIRPFMQALFDDPPTAGKAAEIGQAMPAARSLRLAEIAAGQPGNLTMKSDRSSWGKSGNAMRW